MPTVLVEKPAASYAKLAVSSIAR